MQFFDKLISPKSVAIVGASTHPQKIGYQIVENLVNSGFSGGIYPINPKGGEINGLKMFVSLSELPTKPDLVVIAIPSVLVPKALKECGENKISSVVIISAGFSEVGPDGKKLEDEVAKIASDYGIILLGPNCLGLINTSIGLNASFANGFPKTGGVSVISQSGAIISSLIDLSYNSSTGFAKIFSLGNMAVLSEAELLEYLYEDDETKVIIGYLERLEVSDKLTETLVKHSKTKPTILLFGGKSLEGAKAAASHTGSIVSSYIAAKTYLTQAGVILAESLEELLMLSEMFSVYQKIEGDRVAIITNAGGPSIAASDAISAAGLALPELSRNLQSELSKVLRKEASTKNPVDLLGDAAGHDYAVALEIIDKASDIDAVLVLLTPQTSTEIEETAEIIAKHQSQKPIVPVFIGGESLSKAKMIIRSSGKPCFDYPEKAVSVLRTLYKFSGGNASLEVPKKGHRSFDMSRKSEIITEYDLPVHEYKTVTNFDELKKAAARIGYPVVLKIADNTAHKTDVGGIVLDIKSEAELNKAFEKIGSPAIIGKMIYGKLELLLGIKKDRNVGTSILFGTGGIFSEIYADFSYRIAPITQEIAEQMIQETKIGKILAGARNQKKYDLAKLANIIVNAARFADDFANILEVDFNPIIVDADSFHIVDTRIIIK